jgi:hypothetical protein
MTINKHGMELLQDPWLNKSTAFTEAERQSLGIVGLVPDVTETMDAQLSRVMMQLKEDGVYRVCEHESGSSGVSKSAARRGPYLSVGCRSVTGNAFRHFLRAAIRSICQIRFAKACDRG